MSFFKRLAMVLPMIPLLGSCSMFQPSEKVIEYDEEVKLHDGSMIWVHIKRHYFLTGGALGDAGSMKPSYLPSAVEISWDTGFPNVGRKSVFFNKTIYFIERFDNIWYVVGSGEHRDDLKMGKSVNCRKVGININQNLDCQFTVNETGNSINQELKDIGLVNMNILYPIGLQKSGTSPDYLNLSKISWQEKLELQKTQSTERQIINKPYSYEIIKN